MTTFINVLDPFCTISSREASFIWTHFWTHFYVTFATFMTTFVTFTQKTVL